MLFSRKRRLRRTALRARRLAAHHLFTLLSGVMLAALLTLVFSSASFRLDRDATARRDSFTPWPTATPGVVPPRAQALPDSSLLVYYVEE